MSIVIKALCATWKLIVVINESKIDVRVLWKCDIIELTLWRLDDCKMRL